MKSISQMKKSIWQPWTSALSLCTISTPGSRRNKAMVLTHQSAKGSSFQGSRVPIWACKANPIGLVSNQLQPGKRATVSRMAIDLPSIGASTTASVRYYSASHPAAGEHDNDARLAVVKLNVTPFVSKSPHVNTHRWMGSRCAVVKTFEYPESLWLYCELMTHLYSPRAFLRKHDEIPVSRPCKEDFR